MLPTSHLAPIIPGNEAALTGAVALADAFSEFSEAAEQLEHSYQELQKEVVQLQATLAERNRSLCASQVENSQMKLTLRQILDSLPCGVLVVEDGSQVSLSNPEACRLLDVRNNAVSKLNDIPEAGRAQLLTVLQDASQTSTEAEFCLNKSGEKRWLAVRSRPLGQEAARSELVRGEAGTHRQTVLIVRDTTSQKKLEEDREAARNVVALAEMSAVLAHEIRNPLGSMELFAGLIGESGGAPEYLMQLRAGIRTLAATVNNVLLFHGGAAPQCTPIRLAESVYEAVEFVRPLAEQRGIELTLLVKAEGLIIRGDHNGLQQVFLNLALNAFRHTPAGGWLRITVGRTEGKTAKRAQVEFSDNGCGIEPSVQSRIFEAGFSGNGQTPGLGLAVCKRVVERHGGAIGVKSETGRGTTFVLEFPIES